jgi:hypothetical protein
MPNLILEPINNDDWIQIGSEKKSGVLNLAKIPSHVGDVGTAWFKYRLNNSVGPIPANEYIASCLGNLLNLPVAKIQFKEFEGRDGVLSFIVAPEPYTWSQFPYKEDIAAYIQDFDMLAYMLVFDVFINNVDRNPDNLLYSRATMNRRKYHFHLIDHGHSLWGPGTEPSTNDFRFEQHIMLEELRKLFNHGLEFFEPALNNVKNISTEQIQQIIEAVPEKYLTDQQKQHTKELLLSRQEKIYNEFETYCTGRA